MSLKSCLITGTLALIAGCLAGYWLCHLQWEASESQMNESQARQETERLEKAMEENRNLHEAVSQMQIRAKKENDDAKRENDLLLVSIAVLSGCQSPPVRVSTCPKPDIPALMIEKREPNLTQRLLKVFSLSDETETPQSGI